MGDPGGTVVVCVDWCQRVGVLFERRIRRLRVVDFGIGFGSKLACVLCTLWLNLVVVVCILTLDIVVVVVVGCPCLLAGSIVGHVRLCLDESVHAFRKNVHFDGVVAQSYGKRALLLGDTVGTCGCVFVV